LAADIEGPANEMDDPSAYKRARRRRAALYATLLKANFPVPAGTAFTFVANAAVLGHVNQAIGNRRPAGPIQSGPQGRLRLDAADLRLFWDAVVAARDAGVDFGDWIDADLDAILVMYKGSRGSGYRFLEALRVYHSTAVNDDYARSILDELAQGKSSSWTCRAARKRSCSLRLNGSSTMSCVMRRADSQAGRIFDRFRYSSRKHTACSTANA
jgi:hypothetical protein